MVGHYVKTYRIDEPGSRPETCMLTFDPGASYPNHNHPAGEEVYMVAVPVRFSRLALSAAEFLYPPPGGTHSLHSKTGCVMVYNVPEEVEIL